MLVAFRISTGEPINDFQPNATSAVLTGNAERAGVPVRDVEVRDVTEAEYAALDLAVNGAAREAEKQIATTHRLQVAAIETKLAAWASGRLSLEEAEVRALKWMLGV